MIVLTVPDVLAVGAVVLGLDPDQLVEATDLNAVDATVAQLAATTDQSGDLAASAACLLHGLAARAPFPAGNRRIAYLTTLQFLALNGHDLDLADPADLGRTMAAVVAGHEGPHVLTRRIRDRLRPPAGRAPLPRTENPMPTRPTDSLRAVMVLAEHEARKLGHHLVGTEHIVLGLLGDPGSGAARTLASSGVTLAAARREVAMAAGQFAVIESARHLPYAPRVEEALAAARQEALELGHPHVGSEHLLLAALKDDHPYLEVTLKGLDVTADELRHSVLEALMAVGATTATPEERPTRQPSALVDELTAEVTRLRAKLRANGIDPDS